MPYNDTTSITGGPNQQITDWYLGDDRVFSGTVTGLTASDPNLTDAYFTLKLNPNDIDANAIVQKHITVTNSLAGLITQPATLLIHLYSGDYQAAVSAGPSYWWDIRVITAGLKSTVTIASGQVQFQQNVTQTNAAGTPAAKPNNGNPRIRGFAPANPGSNNGTGLSNVGDIFYNSSSSSDTGWRCTAQGSPGTWVAFGAQGPAGPAGASGSSGSTSTTTATTTTAPAKALVMVRQVFTANGTYVPTSGMIYADIECLGGGAGGGSASNAAIKNSGGGGGGSGSYSRRLATAAQIGVSQVVTIGSGGAGGTTSAIPGANGGDTSLGTICVGKGGTGGTSALAGAGASGGAGGSVGTGDITAAGNNGSDGTGLTTTGYSGLGGAGAASVLGGGGGAIAAEAGGTVNGLPGGNYGGGGGGGSTATNTAAIGGPGASGIVIITEFTLQ